MKTWNKPYPKKRLRILNVLRQYHYAMVSGDTSYEKTQKAIEVISGLNKRLQKHELRKES